MSAEEEIQEPSCDKPKPGELEESGIALKDKSLAKQEEGRGNGTIGSAVVSEAKEKISYRSKCFVYFKRTPILAWIERIILISICVAVAAGFSAPIIIYALDTDRGNNATISVDIDVDNCPASSTNGQVCVKYYR